MFEIRVGDQRIKAPFLLLAFLDTIFLFLSVYVGAYLRFIKEVDPLLAASESVGNLVPRAIIHSSVLVV